MGYRLSSFLSNQKLYCLWKVPFGLELEESTQDTPSTSPSNRKKLWLWHVHLFNLLGILASLSFIWTHSTWKESFLESDYCNFIPFLFAGWTTLCRNINAYFNDVCTISSEQGPCFLFPTCNNTLLCCVAPQWQQHAWSCHDHEPDMIWTCAHGIVKLYRMVTTTQVESHQTCTQAVLYTLGMDLDLYLLQCYLYT